MHLAKTISIALSPELLLKAKAVAEKEDWTFSELFREALGRYVSGEPESNGLLRRARGAGAALGIATEEDVERLSDEFRVEKRSLVRQ